jgi:hypothetical protein
MVPLKRYVCVFLFRTAKHTASYNIYAQYSSDVSVIRIHFYICRGRYWRIGYTNLSINLDTERTVRGDKRGVLWRWEEAATVLLIFFLDKENYIFKYKEHLISALHDELLHLSCPSTW